jgi:cold shock CspA family protein
MSADPAAQCNVYVKNRNILSREKHHGDRVSFDVVQGAKGPAAANVTRL